MSSASTQSVSFFNSITTKIIIALIVAFTLVTLAVLYVVNQEGRVKVRQETDKLIIQNGENAVSLVSFDIKSVMRSAAEIRDTSEILPLNEASYQGLLNNVFDDDIVTLLGSGGIWPKAYALDPTTESLPMARLRSGDSYVAVPPDNDNVKDYLQASWFGIVESIKPEACLWNNVVASQTGNELAISCGLAIMRDDEFWGATTVNFTLDSIQANLEKLDAQLGTGYALLVDNSNQMVASSNPELLPYLDPETNRPILLNDWVKTNPAWQPILDTLNEEREQKIAAIRPQLPKALIDGFNAYDANMQTLEGSMMINFAAFKEDRNEYVGEVDSTFMDTFALTGDSVYQDNSQAYLFKIPETHWKLIIVKPESEVNAIADTLSQNLIKYLIAALIATAAFIFFLLKVLALRPLQATTDNILEADRLIDNKEYNRLSGINFKNTGQDEIGIVNRSLSSLLTRIQDNEGKLADINQQLEMKVEERTAELKNTLKELKDSQLNLIRSEKMATLGQMVAGVAHEVNTPLSYVQNNLEIIGQLTEQYEELVEKVESLKTAKGQQDISAEDLNALTQDILASADEIQEDELGEEVKELVKDSLFGVEQISEMVLNLRNFARLDESKVKRTDIAECIDASLKISRNSIKYIEVKTNYTDTPDVLCSPSQINQVLVNLINNAAQAIGDKPDGQITISTSADADNVYINVKDNGSGMSEDTIAKIFEPFFTTKGAGEGTGLGMAISQQIMEQHGGDISVESQVGVGTTFRLSLPIDGQLNHDKSTL